MPSRQETPAKITETTTASAAPKAVDYGSLRDDVETWKQRHALLRESLKELDAKLREFDRELGTHARHLAKEPAAKAAKGHGETARRRHGGLSGRHREIRYRLMRLSALMDHVTDQVH